MTAKIIELANRDAVANYLPKNAIGCEIGVREGINALRLFEKAQPALLHLVDPWEPTNDRELWGTGHAEVLQKLQRPIASGRVVVHVGKSGDILPTWSDSYLDWAYIDGDHCYPGISLDIQLAIKKVKKGGIVAGHDLVCATALFGTDVMRAVLEAVQAGQIRIVALSRETWTDWVAIVL